MTKIKKLKLNQLNKAEIKKNEQKLLKGGGTCSYMCGCPGVNEGMGITSFYVDDVTWAQNY